MSVEVLEDKKIHAVFYKSESGNEPVKDELLNLGRPVKTMIGEDINFVELHWKIDRSYVDQLRKVNCFTEKTIYEIRSKVFVGGVTKEYRVLFFVINDLMILTHMFEKKTRTTPAKEINLAWDRMKKWMREQKANHEKK